MLDFRGAERMHVEANVFPIPAVVIAFQRADLVERHAEPFDAAPSVLRLADVGALAREPEDEYVRAENFGDVNGAERAFNRVLAMLRVVAGVGSVDGLGREPEPGRDHFGGDAFAV